MLEFIVVNDNILFQKRIQECIKNVMKKQNTIYRITIYDDYTDEAYQIISKNKKNMKIYLLDMETPSNKLQDYVRKIRKYDFSSHIIGFGDERFLFVALQNKFTDYMNYFESQWEKKLKDILKFLLDRETKREILRFVENEIQYTLHINDICFLQRYKRKKTVIQTSTCSYLVSYSLEELKQKLPSYFVYENHARISNLHQTTFLNTPIMNNRRKKHQPQRGKRYSDEVHQKAVYMYYNGATEEQIINEFGMHINTLRIWIAKDKTEKYQKSEQDQIQLQKEISMLHTKNVQLKAENENLKNEKMKSDAACERFRKAVHILSSGDEQ